MFSIIINRLQNISAPPNVPQTLIVLTISKWLLCATNMTYIKADDRKSNALLFLGVTCLALTYFTLTSNSQATRAVCTTFLIVVGLLLFILALLLRYKVSLSDNELILKSRFGLLSKRIPFDEIKKVKVLDKEYPVTLYRNTILHLLLWDKKFNRIKQIDLFDTFGSKISTIDGQAIDNDDFAKLIKVLKNKAAHNSSINK